MKKVKPIECKICDCLYTTNCDYVPNSLCHGYNKINALLRLFKRELNRRNKRYN